MIGHEELKRISKMSGSKAWQQEKHYIQTLVLKSLYSEFGNRLVFKGGTALWFFHGLPRFSEDLDFSAIKDLDTERILDTVSGDLDAIGVENSLKTLENSKRSFSFRINAKGPLFDGVISTCYVRVEISLRSDLVIPYKEMELNPAYADITPFSVALMDLEEIAAEKIRAIIKRNKARDVYDLAFLFGLGIEPDIGLVNKKLGYYEEEFSYSEFVESLGNKEDIWESELTNLILGKFPDFQKAKKEIIDKMKKLK